MSETTDKQRKLPWTIEVGDTVAWQREMMPEEKQNVVAGVEGSLLKFADRTQVYIGEGTYCRVLKKAGVATEPTPRKCEGCEKEFTPEDKRGRQMYCSRECRLKTYGSKKRKTQEDKVCEGCDALYTPGRKDQKYCSVPCRQKTRVESQARSAKRAAEPPAAPEAPAGNGPIDGANASQEQEKAVARPVMASLDFEEFKTAMIGLLQEAQMVERTSRKMHRVLEALREEA